MLGSSLFLSRNFRWPLSVPFLSCWTQGQLSGPTFAARMSEHTHPIGLALKEFPKDLERQRYAVKQHKLVKKLYENEVKWQEWARVISTDGWEGRVAQRGEESPSWP